MTGFPVDVPEVLETDVVGSAILAATGTAAHPDLQTAIQAMTRIATRIEPDGDRTARYDRAFDAYVRLYPAIEPVIRRLASTRTELERATA